MSGLWIVVLVLVVFCVYAIVVYNGFVVLKNRVNEAWSDIEVQLKRRYDMIPNLVETVKGYAKHESQTLENVIQARNMAMGVDKENLKKMAQNENILSGTLKSLFALSENYPQLQANTNFLELQRELRDTEDKLQAARRFYNGNVMAFNTKIELFPSNIVAALFHFEKREFFELADNEAAAKQPVSVKF